MAIIKDIKIAKKLNVGVVKINVISTNVAKLCAVDFYYILAFNVSMKRKVKVWKSVKCITWESSAVL